MSTLHKSVFVLACDACDAIASADWMDLDATLMDAHQQGWRVGEFAGGDDLCPGCRAERDAEYEEHERQRRSKR